MNILEESKDLYPQLLTYRRHIHKNPELSFHEHHTSAYIRSVLSELGIEHRVIGTTGVVAHIGNGERCVALRADIDALPIVEETGLEYSSTNDGVMHACGHDCHTAMLLGAAHILKKYESSIHGTVKLVFQPGEEKSPGGASILLNEGLFDERPPEVIFGQHVNPDARTGIAEFVSGPMMASADELYWTLTGYGAHAAQPHKGKDPILAAAELIQHLQSLVTRQRNPLDAGVITITSIHGGSATNIIPDTVEIKGTLRSFNEEWRWATLKRIEEHSSLLCSLHGVESSFTPVIGYPALVNDQSATEFIRAASANVMNTSSLHDFEPKMWAEDFAFYAQRIPAVFWMLGVNPSDETIMPGLHNAKFSPDESALPIGTALLVNSALQWLQKS
ncbi:MAG: amidohydrolase [Candidatus Kapabacteria bacterium]|nr:amidohydrolase [Candidatus Kapabacteria bacterium]